MIYKTLIVAMLALVGNAVITDPTGTSWYSKHVEDVHAAAPRRNPLQPQHVPSATKATPKLAIRPNVRTTPPNGSRRIRRTRRAAEVEGELESSERAARLQATSLRELRIKQLQTEDRTLMNETAQRDMKLKQVRELKKQMVKHFETLRRNKSNEIRKRKRELAKAQAAHNELKRKLKDERDSAKEMIQKLPKDRRPQAIQEHNERQKDRNQCLKAFRSKRTELIEEMNNITKKVEQDKEQWRRDHLYNQKLAQEQKDCADLIPIHKRRGKILREIDLLKIQIAEIKNGKDPKDLPFLSKCSFEDLLKLRPDSQSADRLAWDKAMDKLDPSPLQDKDTVEIQFDNGRETTSLKVERSRNELGSNMYQFRHTKPGWGVQPFYFSDRLVDPSERTKYKSFANMTLVKLTQEQVEKLGLQVVKSGEWKLPDKLALSLEENEDLLEPYICQM